MTSGTNLASAAARRLSALTRYDILDTAPEAEFDNLARLAQMICQAPVVTIGFLDEHREWLKAAIGIDLTELALADSLSARALGSSQVLVVPDAKKNCLFSDLPLVAPADGFRFYAAAPFLTRDGTPIGALSVMDRSPRATFPIEQRTALQTLAAQVMAQLDLGRTVRELAIALCQNHAAKAAANELRLLLPMCSDCKNIRSDDDYWQAVDEYLSAHTDPYLTHGICTECQEEASSPVSLRPQPYPKLLGSPFGRMRN